MYMVFKKGFYISEGMNVGGYLWMNRIGWTQTKSRRSHQTFDGSYRNTGPLSSPVWMDSARAIRADIQCH